MTLKEVPCVVLLTPKTSPNAARGTIKEEIICGPFALRASAERFAIALAEGGCITWGTSVTIKAWSKTEDK